MLQSAALRQRLGGQHIDPLIPRYGLVKRVATVIYATIIDLRRAVAIARGQFVLADRVMARMD